MINSIQSNSGFVWLVGAGPGAADLITVRALNLLRRAEAVVCDDLANRELLAHCPPGIELHFVGKRAGCHSAAQSEINALLVALGSAGRKVVRLKGGDPLIFGRAGEEMQALREAGIPYEIVPGVTAATAASAAAGLPLTHRDHSSAVVIVTGHQCAANTTALDWGALAKLRATICFYMGVRRLPEIAANLTSHGMSADMPLAVISEASLPTQKIFTGTLAEAGPLSAGLIGQPALIVVGEVVRHVSFTSLLPGLHANAQANSGPGPKPDFFPRLAQAWQRHWAGIMSADSAADTVEPELPASVFVHPQPRVNHPPTQAGGSGLAARQRSASISSNKG